MRGSYAEVWGPIQLNGSWGLPGARQWRHGLRKRRLLERIKWYFHSFAYPIHINWASIMYHVLYHSDCLGSCSEQSSSLMELHSAYNTRGYKWSMCNSLILWLNRCPPCWYHFYTERSVELSGCFSGQPPSAQDRRTSQITRMTHLSPTSQSFPTSSRSPPCRCSSSTNRHGKGTSSERLKARVTDSDAFGAEYHYWLYVTQMVSGAGRWTWQWVHWVWGIQTAMVIAAVWLWGSGSLRVVFNDWWAKRVPVTEGELNYARSFIHCCSLPMTFRFHRTEGCVCVHSQTP